MIILALGIWGSIIRQGHHPLIGAWECGRRELDLARSGRRQIPLGLPHWAIRQEILVRQLNSRRQLDPCWHEVITFLLPVSAAHKPHGMLQSI